MGVTNFRSRSFAGRRARLALCGLGMAFFSLSAQAHPPSPTHQRVVALRGEGIEAYEEERLADARQLFDQAAARSRAATDMLWAARARVELQQWTQALEFYRMAHSAAASEDPPELDRGSREQAEKERSELLSRVPRLRILLDAETKPDQVAVFVDGKQVPPTALQSERKGKRRRPFLFSPTVPIDPGRHTVVAVKGKARKQAEVVVQEGQKQSVRLFFPSPSSLRQRQCRAECESLRREDDERYFQCKRTCIANGAK